MKRSVKERMREIKYRLKNGVGPDTRKYNFPRTVVSVICDCEELENRN